MQLTVFGPKSMLRGFPKISVRFVGQSLLTETESETVKNLGLVMDKHFTFDAHIDQLVGKCTGILVALAHAKYSMPHDILAHIVNALVMSAIYLFIQTEAERRRREAGVKQSMEIRLGSCMYVCGWVGMYGIWNYLANQGT